MAGRYNSSTMRMKSRLLRTAFAALALALPAAAHAQSPGPGFKTVVYVPVEVVLKMKDPHWLEQSWARISGQVHVDKVYLETYRSRVIADDQLIEDVKKFFTSRGVEVAGGIC